MAYIPVPKDLSKVKTKVALNMTQRQLICFSLAGVIGIPSYLLSRNFLGNDVATLFMVVIMLPFFFVAMYEKDGFPAEKIFYHIIRQKLLNQGIRPYKTENFYSKLEEQNKIAKEVAYLENKAKRAAAQGKIKITYIQKSEKSGRSGQKASWTNKGREKAS